MTEADDETLQRIYRSVEKTLQARAARAAIRRDLDAARQVGLERRHTEKLARTSPRGSRGLQRGRGPQEETMPTVPPCCADADEPPCEQHRQAAAILRNDGLRSRSGSGSRVIGEPGKARPAATDHLDRED